MQTYRNQIPELVLHVPPPFLPHPCSCKGQELPPSQSSTAMFYCPRLGSYKHLLLHLQIPRARPSCQSPSWPAYRKKMRRQVPPQSRTPHRRPLQMAPQVCLHWVQPPAWSKALQRLHPHCTRPPAACTPHCARPLAASNVMMLATSALVCPVSPQAHPQLPCCNSPWGRQPCKGQGSHTSFSSVQPHPISSTALYPCRHGSPGS